MYVQTAGCFTLTAFLDPRRLRSQGHEDVVVSREENKLSWGRVSDLSPGSWQVSCYLVEGGMMSVGERKVQPISDSPAAPHTLQGF